MTFLFYVIHDAYLRGIFTHYMTGPEDEARLLTVMTHNIKNFSVRNPHFVKRLFHLNSCYKTAALGLPDVLVIQEAKCTGVGINFENPVQQLADYLNLHNEREFIAKVTGDLEGGGGERAGLIYNSARLTLINQGVGIPIAHRLDGNLSLGTPGDFGYDVLENAQQWGAQGGTRLFLRSPAYWLLQCRETGIQLIVCSVHLRPRPPPDSELRRLRHLLPGNTERLLQEKKIFILAGDMNFSSSTHVDSQKHAVTTTEGRWSFAINFIPYETNDLNATNTLYHWDESLDDFNGKVCKACLY